MNTAAATSGWPTRDRALLIAEAMPELRTGTELMSAVVSGATSSEIPIPKMIDAGSGPDERVDRRDERCRIAAGSPPTAREVEPHASATTASRPP